MTYLQLRSIISYLDHLSLSPLPLLGTPVIISALFQGQPISNPNYTSATLIPFNL